MNKFFLNLLTVLILGIIQVSFLTTWPEPINGLNLILSLAIFLTIISRYRQALWLAVGGGLFLELFSFKIFGLTVLSLFLTVVIINFLFTNFFANYSFFSLTVLGVIGNLSNILLIIIGNALMNFLGFEAVVSIFSINFFHLIFWQTLLNLLILYLIFFVFHFLNMKLKINLPTKLEKEL